MNERYPMATSTAQCVPESMAQSTARVWAVANDRLRDTAMRLEAMKDEHKEALGAEEAAWAELLSEARPPPKDMKAFTDRPIR